MKVFVTGASGYIGGSIAARLVAAGHRVTGLTRSPERAEALRVRGIEPVAGSLDEADLLAQAARRADAVINAFRARVRTDLRTHVAKGGTLPASVVSDLEDGLDAAARGITTALASLGR